MRTFGFTILCLSLCMGSLSSTRSDAASFDCAKAKSKPEHLICADADLSAMDDELGALYKRAKALSEDKAEFNRLNRREWQTRESTCVDKSCLLDWYAKRRLQLFEIVEKRENASTRHPASADSTTDAEMSRVRSAITQYAAQRGETESEFARRINSTPEKIESLAYTLEQNGASVESTLKSLEGLNSSLQDPQKVKLLECIGVKVYEDPQPAGHPPSESECARIEQQAGVK